MDKKLWSIHIVEYYSVLKRSELSSHEKTKTMLLSKRSQTEKATHSDSNYMRLWRIKTRETVKSSMAVRGVESERDEEVNHRGF